MTKGAPRVGRSNRRRLAKRYWEGIEMAKEEAQRQEEEQDEDAGARSDVEPPFSLTPTIFTPFTGLPPGPQQTLDPTEKLQKILETLPAQQDAVKRKLFSMVHSRAEQLVAKAREELDALNGGSEDTLVFGEESEDPDVKQEVSAMMQRLSVPFKKDAKTEDYEVKPGTFEPKPPAQDTDTEMTGTSTAPPKPRTATVIRVELSRDLRYLIEEANARLEGYDNHSRVVVEHYKQQLERKTSKPPTGLRGILRKSGRESNPVSPVVDSRKMSVGQIFANANAGAVATAPVRTFESIGDVARRGSK